MDMYGDCNTDYIHLQFEVNVLALTLWPCCKKCNTYYAASTFLAHYYR